MTTTLPPIQRFTFEEEQWAKEHDMFDHAIMIWYVNIDNGNHEPTYIYSRYGSPIHMEDAEICYVVSNDGNDTPFDCMDAARAHVQGWIDEENAHTEITEDDIAQEMHKAFYDHLMNLFMGAAQRKADGTPPHKLDRLWLTSSMSTQKNVITLTTSDTVFKITVEWDAVII